MSGPNNICDRCGCKMRKVEIDDPQWDYPERNHVWLCSNIICIMDTYGSCRLFGHEPRPRGQKFVCEKCDKEFDEYPS